VIIQTHGGGFGSGYVAGKTGLVFNSAMDWMTLQPGQANTVAPGKAVGWCIGGMLQFHKEGKPQLIVGSPGSFGILQSVPQVAMNFVDFGMNIQDAIAAPRFRWKDELGSVPAKEIIMETRVAPEVIKTLKEMGYVIDTSLGDWSMTVGGAQGISIDHKTGWLMGGADPRRNGYAAGW
jgi:gamma-glutamyltranspeptidase/glutathione hydrolase